GDLDVGGQTLLGYVRRTCDYPVGQQHGDCSCADNERVISGGTYVTTPYDVRGFNQFVLSVRESRPFDEDTWRVACVQTLMSGIGFQHTHANTVVDCGEINIISARVGN